jgi:chaperone required for assembly of F1-ATPase
MSGWVAKRFWSKVTVSAAPGGFALCLDAKPLRTPLKAPFVVPSEALAQEVAAEWLAQAGTVNPATMPFTRTANSAIDKVAPQFAEVAAMLASYGASDLLCYRATGPDALIARQAAAWDPLLDWAANKLSAPLVTTAGVMHVDQPGDSLSRLSEAVAALSSFQIAAFHDLVAMSGSLVLALAVCRGRLPAEAAWSLSRVDEIWQIEAWGQDEEAAAVATLKQAAFLHAARFYSLCG